ncbi:carbohydrate kinase family protein [Streptomyces shenzhenensis]|nr:carbohydrate kinase family protein [Streptomyces shenzhenensis]
MDGGNPVSDTAEATVPTVQALFVGTVFLDIVLAGMPRLPRPGAEEWADERAVSVGGIANTAVAAARLGATSALVSTLGADDFSGIALKQLRAEPLLDLSNVTIQAEREIPLTVVVPMAGERMFLSHGSLAQPAPYAPDVRARTMFVALNDGMPTWVGKFRDAGTLVVAGVGWDEDPAWPRQVRGYLDTVDVLVLNAAEARHLTGEQDLETAARQLASPTRSVVVTCGPHGAIAVGNSAAATIHVRAPAVAAKDTTGAGDVLIGALMAATSIGETLEDSLAFAVTAAADATTRLGGARAAPDLSQLLERASTASGASLSAARIAQRLRAPKTSPLATTSALTEESHP